MPRGAPDWSTRLGEIPTQVIHNIWSITLEGELPPGYSADLSINLGLPDYTFSLDSLFISWGEEDNRLGHKIIKAGEDWLTSYINVTSTLTGRRLFEFKGDETFILRFENYGLVKRYIRWTGFGIAIEIGTMEPKRQVEPPPPPPIKEDEVLFLVDNALTGKFWVVGKLKPLPKGA